MKYLLTFLFLFSLVFFLQDKVLAEGYTYAGSNEGKSVVLKYQLVKPKEKKYTQADIEEEDDDDDDGSADLEARKKDKKGKNGKVGKKGNKGLKPDAIEENDFPRASLCNSPVCEVRDPVLPDEICQNECPKGSGFHCEGRHYFEPIDLNVAFCVPD